MVRELEDPLIKELWAFDGAPIAVYGFCVINRATILGNWFRSYGNENWEFNEHGLMF